MTHVTAATAPGSWGVLANSGVARALGAFAIGMLVLAVFAGACECFFVAEKIIERGFA